VRQVPICPDPIFIIGSPRSGTTAFAEALGEHPGLWFSCEGLSLHRLYGGGRLEDAYAAEMLWDRWLARERVTREEFLERMGLGFNALFSSRSGGRRWIDKTPDNTPMVATLADMFPHASFLHLLRDGRRTVNSMVNCGLASRWVDDFRVACREWKQYVTIAIDFASRYPGRCLCVRIEELAADAERGFDAIYRFVGVSHAQAPIDYLRTNQINSSVRPGSTVLGRARERYDPWPTWTLQHKRIFLEEAGVAMLRYGMVGDEEMRQMEEDARDPCDESPSWTDELAQYRSGRDIAAIDRDVPRDAVLLVVGRGNERLLELDGRCGWHFPRDERGEYSGRSASSEEAIRHLEALRKQGAQYLLFPSDAYWWLEYDSQFTDHLDARYRRVGTREDGCVIYELQPPDEARTG